MFERAPDPVREPPSAAEFKEQIRVSFEEEFPTWYKQIYKEDNGSEEGSDIILAELIALYSEWMFAYKVTDACAKAAYKMFQTLVPPSSNIGSWPELKKALEYLNQEACVEIDLCPNDCIAFIDCKHPKLAHYKHAHRDWCPVCGADRRLTVNGQIRSAKKGYYFPMAKHLQGLFDSEELVDLLPWDAGESRSGSIKRSYGWHKKVVQNPRMNAERRNQGYVFMSDGFPMFRGKHSRGCVPIAGRNANMPDRVSNKFRHIHLSGLYPCDFWMTNKAGKWQRVDRQPKSLIPLLWCLADDLLHWEDGDYIVDCSKPEGDPDRQFLLRVILLYWCGDYPGLKDVSGFCHGIQVHGMCHWCDVIGPSDKETGSQVYGGYFRSGTTLSASHIHFLSRSR